MTKISFVSSCKRTWRLEIPIPNERWTYILIDFVRKHHGWLLYSPLKLDYSDDGAMWMPWRSQAEWILQWWTYLREITSSTQVTVDWVHTSEAVAANMVTQCCALLRWHTTNDSWWMTSEQCSREISMRQEEQNGRCQCIRMAQASLCTGITKWIQVNWISINIQQAGAFLEKVSVHLVHVIFVCASWNRRPKRLKSYAETNLSSIQRGRRCITERR